MEIMSFNYLGFPLGGNQKAACFWDPLIDKLRVKLDKCRSLLLLKGGQTGRLILSQSVLNCLSLYWLSLLMGKVTTSLDKMVSKFIWNGGVCHHGCNLVSWDIYSLPTS